MSTNKSIAKSAGIIGLATLCSRILGFFRDIIIARFFGTGIYAQAFVVAFRIPNLLRDLVGEGATNAAFVPVLTESLAKGGKEEFWRLVRVLFNVLLIILIALTALGIFAAPLIVRIIAPGFVNDPEKFQLTVSLTKFLFPFLILVGLWALAVGVLNSLKHFTAPAFGPAVLNLAIIVCALWYRWSISALAVGALIGAALQLLIQFPPLLARGIKIRGKPEFRHPAAKRIGTLLIPRALGACVYQINVFVTTVIASLSHIVGEGAVAALYYANRVWQLPLAMFGIAIAQASLPTMSAHAARGEMQELKDTFLFSLRTLFFILLPSCIGLIVLNRPIVTFLFERGAFSAYSTNITADALFFYLFGLMACGGIKLLVNVFYSLQDTSTPVKAASVSLVLNVALCLLLMKPMRIGGLALANSLAATFNSVMLYLALRRKIGDIRINRIFGSLIKICAACLIMGFVCYFIRDRVHVFLSIVFGIMAYIASCFALRIKELQELLRWALKKK